MKSCFLMKPIRKRIMATETAKATIIPVRRIAVSIPVKWKPYLTIFRRLAPAMTGIARMNVNCAATVRDTPIRRPPIIVDPDLDVPGKQPPPAETYR